MKSTIAQKLVVWLLDTKIELENYIKFEIPSKQFVFALQRIKVHVDQRLLKYRSCQHLYLIESWRTYAPCDTTSFKLFYCSRTFQNILFSNDYCWKGKSSETLYIMYICNISWCCCDLETWHTRHFERATVFNSFRDHQCLSLCVEVLPQLSWKDSISIEMVFMFNS